MAARTRRIESGEQTVVGVNDFTETAESPLGGEGSDPHGRSGGRAEMIGDVVAWRAGRDQAAVDAALDELRRVAATDENVMPATIALAKAGGTTGEWGAVMREVFGEYRAPTGVGGASGGALGALAAVAERVRSMPGGPPRFLVAKPGLDGHSNGAEQIAVAARDAGHGGHLLRDPAHARADRRVGARRGPRRDRPVDPVGVAPRARARRARPAARRGASTAPVVVGGIIPEDDRPRLLAVGVAAVYTPKDFELATIMRDIADLDGVTPIEHLRQAPAA